MSCIIGSLGIEVCGKGHAGDKSESELTIPRDEREVAWNNGSVLRRAVFRYKSKYKKVGVLSMWKAKSNV